MMVALAAVLLLLNVSKLPLLFVMMAFPAELPLLKFTVSLFVKLGANAELLTVPRPLMLQAWQTPQLVELQQAPSTQLPVVLLGGAGGRIHGGRVLDYRGKPDRQMCRLYLSMMDKMNVQLPRFGDSTEPLGDV